jgi:hypothetical protein
MVFSGSVVPILNKLLITANFGRISSAGNESMTLPSIVRVEPCGESQQSTPEPESEVNVQSVENDGEAVISMARTKSSGNKNATPVVGQMVARECGSSIFRGVIEKVRFGETIILSLFLLIFKIISHHIEFSSRAVKRDCSALVSPMDVLSK